MIDVKDVILRDATLSDINEIMELNKQLYEVEYEIEHKISSNLKQPQMYFASKEFAREKIDKQKLIRDKKKNKFIVLVYRENIIGYINGYIKDYDVYISKALFIDEIVVDEEYRHHGLADLLINELIRWGKKKRVKQVLLYVFKDNKPAMNKYNELGFQERHVCLFKDI